MSWAGTLVLAGTGVVSGGRRAEKRKEGGKSVVDAVEGLWLRCQCRIG